MVADTNPSSAKRSLPWVRGALDGFLAVLPPGVLIRRDVGDLGADRRHSDGPLHTVFPAENSQRPGPPLEKPLPAEKNAKKRSDIFV